MPTFSKHAREQMDKRGITEQDVDLALRRQVRTEPGQPGTIWVVGRAPGGELRVCVRLADRSYVITAAWPG